MHMKCSESLSLHCGKDVVQSYLFGLLMELIYRVNSYQLSHTLLLYLVFYMLYQREAELTNKINALFRRLKRFGYTTCNITVLDLIDTSGRDLFRKLCSSEHSLHHLLPPERKYSNLRNRGHPYELPEYCTNLHKKSFIIPSLYLYS